MSDSRGPIDRLRRGHCSVVNDVLPSDGRRDIVSQSWCKHGHETMALAPLLEAFSLSLKLFYYAAYLRLSAYGSFQLKITPLSRLPGYGFTTTFASRRDIPVGKICAKAINIRGHILFGK